MAFLYPWKGSSVAIWIPERNCSPRSSSQFLYTVPDLPGTRSNNLAVGWSSPRVRSTMPVSSRGPRRRRSWWCHTCSSTPSTRTPAKRAGSSDAACRHGLIWDHTVFHVVTSCRARPAMVAPSKRNCRIAQRIARVPRRARGAHIRSSCSRNVTVWQACSRHIHRRIVPSDPRRDPGPGRVYHLHHHAPVALCDHPTTRAPRQLVARLNIKYQSIWGCEPRSSDGSPPNRRADHTDHNDQATRSSSR